MDGLFQKALASSLAGIGMGWRSGFACISQAGIIWAPSLRNTCSRGV